MHPRRTWIVLAALATFAGQAAVIYKWTDSDGLVHYSDQPVPGAEKIVTAGTASTAATAARPGNNFTAPINLGAPKKSASAGLGYAQLSIASPTPEQAFFGEEAVGVQLTVDPALKPGHTITWHLNGKEISNQDSSATQMTLPRLDRGTYVIAATITDPGSGQSQSTDSTTFYIRQPSALSPLHQKP
jgi:Domain of unknown function (DUF4124)